MGIGTSLNIALSALKTNQRQMEVASNNVANAGATGYSRQTLSTTALVAGDTVFGTTAGKVERELNVQVQRQWRSANGNSAYAQTRAETLDRLDSLFGGPGDSNSLDSLFTKFTSALETLATSPENGAQRLQVASASDALATRLRTLSSDVQGLRQEAETAIGGAVKEVNSLLTQIAGIDKQIVSLGSGDNSTAALEDQRDAAIDQLSQLIDIRVQDQAYGSVAIYAADGSMLYDEAAVQFGFDEHGVIGADDAYSTVRAERGVGTITVVSGSGEGRDVVADGVFRSGKIAAWLELRDTTLPQVQSQLDELAARMATAVGNNAVSGTAATDGGGAAGYDIDLSGFTQGNVVTLKYTDGSGSHTVSFVGHDGTATLGDDYTPDPSDTVVGIDLSGASGSIADQIAAALPGFGVSDQGADVVRIVDDGPSGSIDVDGLTASITADGLQDGAALPLFVDSAGGGAFTGLSGTTRTTAGFASRIVVNPKVTGDPASLVLYDTTTQPNDDTRPRAMLKALTETQVHFDPSVGIGTASAPFHGTLEAYMKQVVTTQGANAEAAQNLADGQGIVTANLEARYDDSRKVDLDTELANLIELQNAYQANARVMTVAREMMQALMDAF